MSELRFSDMFKEIPPHLLEPKRRVQRVRPLILKLFAAAVALLLLSRLIGGAR